MLSVNLLFLASLLYVFMLFLVAFVVDRRTRRRRIGWLQSPVIYTLSISVYCTSWTFYGAVGSAARNGLEFVTIYLGPTLVFIGWWWLLRKLVRIGRANRITSIADLISSRYGKSSGLAVLVTLIAVVATTPYIALQLQSVTSSYRVIATEASETATAFWVAAGMSVFAIIFGTRNLDANERHHGVVAAIALEAIVKLVALLAVGIYATYGLSDGFRDVFRDVPAEAIYGENGIFGIRWVVLTFLSATAIICLPRQFQVTVVENIEERHLATASWLFPAYLVGMSLFTLPIALVGLKVMPAGANPDLFVLTLPLSQDRDLLAMLAFLGGFSSATSMVIVAAIAVSTMVSNHIVTPIALRMLAARQAVSGDVRSLVLFSRRLSIAGILGLGFLHFWFSGGSKALASIGLIAFVGVAQFLPSLMGGLFWRGANRIGAISGLVVGFTLWALTLYLPSFGGDFLLTPQTISDGYFGLSWLRPHALFGMTGLDPLVHAVIWSLGINVLVFVVVSSLTQPGGIEQLQAAIFVDVYRSGGAPSGFERSAAQSEDLYILAQRILGTEPARRLFDDLARAQGATGGLPDPTDTVIARLERELSGSIGAASAHAIVTRIAGRQSAGTAELFSIADESQRLIETTRQLADKSAELERAAEQLRSANERLQSLDAQKDDFLSQVSHELRTPMTSIRSFSEILLDTEDLKDAERRKFVTIIQEESVRLTRLLDEILDISRLESGAAKLTVVPVNLKNAISKALDSVSGMIQKLDVDVRLGTIPEDVEVLANPDRLRQVLINLLSNAVKYNRSDEPEIYIRADNSGDAVLIDVIDNGGGVSREEASVVFEKFARGQEAFLEYGTGLGLPISRAIMRAMGGDLTIEFVIDGTSYFQLRLKRSG
ncbi:ATP-binding protein [Tepidamorphus sp. 3E244]|uniref:ATP-binding protein n=1 Tax=Tepidamorphus sp. 3E244 TaxID=3385498 RepID=UPI0038FCA801